MLERDRTSYKEQRRKDLANVSRDLKDGHQPDDMFFGASPKERKELRETVDQRKIKVDDLDLNVVERDTFDAPPQVGQVVRLIDLAMDPDAFKPNPGRTPSAPAAKKPGKRTPSGRLAYRPGKPGRLPSPGHGAKAARPAAKAPTAKAPTARAPAPRAPAGKPPVVRSGARPAAARPPAGKVPAARPPAGRAPAARLPTGKVPGARPPAPQAGPKPGPRPPAKPAPRPRPAPPRKTQNLGQGVRVDDLGLTQQPRKVPPQEPPRKGPPPRKGR